MRGGRLGVDSHPRSVGAIAPCNASQSALRDIVRFRTARRDGADEARSASRAHDFFGEHDARAIARVVNLAVQYAPAAAAIAITASAIIAVIKVEIAVIAEPD